MNRNRKLVLAFYLPLHFAFGSFYLANAALGDKVNCRNSCWFSMNCADDNALLISDLLGLLGFALIVTAFVLPPLIEYRSQPIIETRIFE